MQSLPSIAKHAKQNGIEPKKSLGQNFLFDSNLCDKIAATADIKKDDVIIEIGPGTAGLTRSILSQNPSKLIVFEKDSRCINLLNDIKYYYPNLEIFEKDALTLNLKEFLKTNNISGKVKILSNLPYNISTTLIANWMKDLDLIKSIHVMVQKEVADRIKSEPNSKNYGRLSVLCQMNCKIEKDFDVSPDSFYPKPKIWSSVISFFPKEALYDLDIIENIEKITHIAFSMRRKMLKASLKKHLPEDAISEIDLNLRAENISVEQYINIAEKLMIQ
jgi:16S rRNA (adenine1518-N6/adenine1519-N6)-dimethyltransferase